MASNPAEETDPFTAALALKRATTARLASSWLSSSLADFPDASEDDNDVNLNGGPLFAPAPPTLGLGAPVPKEFLGGNDLTAKVEQERLRRRLLGPLMKKKKTGGGEAAAGEMKKKVVAEEDEEEDEGRTGLGKKKKKMKRSVENGGNALSEGYEDVKMGNAEDDSTEKVTTMAVGKQMAKTTESISDDEERKVGGKPKFANSFDAYKSSKKKKKRKRVEETPASAVATEEAKNTTPTEGPAATTEETTEEPTEGGDSDSPSKKPKVDVLEKPATTSTLSAAAKERRRRKREKQKNKGKTEGAEASV